jgi:alkanesulfonate monooxygenase SsuD/methylene tetrahydromethanopterin reductase-like flavin-dependent oxidoreductase (luciferase family)
MNSIDLGVIFRPQLPPEQLPAIAQAAERVGLRQLWLWEDCFYAGGIASAATALAATERLQVGVGVLPVPLRNVAMTAMELAALSRLHPGRLRPGLGHGVLDWMGQVGARVSSPMTLLSEYLTALRRLLDGERVTVTGRYVELVDVELEWPPTERVEFHAAAVGPKTLALSGAVADGTVLASETTPSQLRAARAIVDEARAAAGRPGRHHLTVYVMATTGDAARSRLDEEIRFWSADPTLGVCGDADAVAAGLQPWIEAGADSIVLQPAATEPDLEGFIQFVATEVQVLLG